MPDHHDHRDLICRDCGALITCLSCLEIHAAQLPRGPAFTADRYTADPSPRMPVFETIGVTNEFELIEPRVEIAPAPIIVPDTQQSLFV